MGPDEQRISEGQRQDAIRREMLRKSLDRCRVFNPTSQPYTVYWDKFPHLVPANSEAVLPRYVANKYMKEMADKMLTYRSDENVKMENERRIKKGMAVMNKYEEQPQFESQFAIHQPHLRKPILESLWGGVVEEYGKNLPVEDASSIATITSDADLLAEIERFQPVADLTQEASSLIDEVADDKE